MAVIETRLCRAVLLVGLAAVPFLGQAARAEPQQWTSAATNDSRAGSNSADYFVRALRQGSELELFGEIQFGSAQDLRQILAANPQARILHLNSPGGSIAEAREMVLLVQDRGLTTTVDKACMSACTLVFLAGKQRYLATGAKLGFHRAAGLDMSSEEVDAIENVDRDFMLSIGISPAFVDKALSTPSSTIWIPTAVELRTAGVISGLDDRYLISVAEFSGKASENDNALNRALEAIRSADPGHYAAIHEHLLEALKTGAGKTEALATLDAEIGDLFSRYISHASDALAIEYAGVFQRTIARLAARDTEACFFAVHPANAPAKYNLAQTLTREEAGQISSVVLRAVSDGAKRNEPAPSAEQVAGPEAELMTQLRTKYPDDAKALGAFPHGDHATLCKAELRFYSLLVALPSQEQGPLVRFLFASNAQQTTGTANAELPRPPIVHDAK